MKNSSSVTLKKVVKKKQRIEILEALLATYEATGAEPDSGPIKELKQKLKATRTQLATMR